ncbi:MAG: SAM-dependent chlorinase/fluorinase [Bacteroidales bacterium]|nr:SAM-dependent chlorinase/fluorinase [Bacteroidales bacterium]
MGSTIVTLTTDWGYSDFFAGSVKGKLHSYIPGVQVVDITHGIPHYQIIRATFVVKQCCFDFPAGTIHIIDVCSSQTTEHPFVVVECEGHFFICTDNGLPAAVFGGRDYRAVVIDGIRLDTDSQNFAARDLFCKVAALLTQGTPLDELGFPADELCPSTPLITTSADDRIKVHVAYVDAYGNCYLNITYDEFEAYRQGRRFELQVHEFRIGKIVHSYVESDSQSGVRVPLLLTLSSTGYLELAMAYANASELCNLQLNETFVIKFI